MAELNRGARLRELLDFTAIAAFFIELPAKNG